LIIPYEPTLLPIAIQLGRRMHEESRYRNMPFSEAKIATLLQNPNCFGSFAKAGDVYIGFIWGLVQDVWFSDCKTGSDLGLYILPEYRGKSMAPIRLIRAFEDFCKSRGCVEIRLSSSASIDEEKASRLYKMLEYKQCGFITYKNNL
jgi:GNAT superfamily N-acetyltransferase